MGDMGGRDRPAMPSPAFTEVLDRAHARLVGFVRGLLGQEEDARDVVQDVFVDAWHLARRGMPPFAPPLDETAIRRWLFHAAYWKAVSVRRRRGTMIWESWDTAQEAGHLEAGLIRVHGVPSGGFEQRIAEAEVLQVALTSLEDDEAACLLLHVVQGYTSVEISHTLQIAPDAVRKRLSRAMQRLRAAYFALESKGQAEDDPSGEGPRPQAVRKQVER